MSWKSVSTSFMSTPSAAYLQSLEKRAGKYETHFSNGLSVHLFFFAACVRMGVSITVLRMVSKYRVKPITGQWDGVRW